MLYPDQKRDKNIRLALFCGWRCEKRTLSGGFFECLEYEKEGWLSPDEKWYEDGFGGLPDFSQSLKAMHEAENKLDGEQVKVYIARMCHVIKNKDSVFRLINASAEDRFEAFPI